MSDATRLPVLPSADPHADPANMVAVAFLGQFLNHNTRAAYAVDLRIFFEWAARLGVHPLEMKRAHLQAFVVHLVDARRNRPATVVRRMGTISGYYATAVIDRYLEFSPAQHLKLPRVEDDPARRTWLSRFELGTLLHAAKEDGPTSWALVAVLGTIGLRVSAACSIQIEDIGTTEVGYRTVHTIGKGDKPSVKALPIPVMQAVDACVGDRTSGPLFVQRNGAQMSRRSAAARLERLARAAGIRKKVTPHSLRRSVATIALQAGVDLRVVQAQLDHSSERVTLRHYDMLGVEPHAQASHTVAALLASAS